MTQFIDANGRRYGRDLRGAGPNLVLLHVRPPATAHLPSLERPKFFHELLRDFLVSLS